MKWWGWGAENVEFSLSAKRPKFLKWAEGKLNITLKKSPFVPRIENCSVPEQQETQKHFLPFAKKMDFVVI